MNTAPHTGALRLPMLTALLILLISRIRRRFKGAKDTMAVVGEIFAEMQEMRRTAQRRHPHLEL